MFYIYIKSPRWDWTLDSEKSYSSRTTVLRAIKKLQYEYETQYTYGFIFLTFPEPIKDGSQLNITEVPRPGQEQ